MTDPRALVRLATEAAREAATFVRAAVRADEHITSSKSSKTDLVTETDRATERLIVERLLRERPEDGILGEEGGGSPGTSGVTWVIDPIDGTTNFVYGLPGFNTSIAASLDGEVVAGVVVDPLRDELFSATLGGGAACNDEPIACRPLADLSHTLIATGFSYLPERRVAQADVVHGLIGEVRDIRRLGAAALDLCYVAAGRVDGYFESGLQPWDLAAGGLIAREAGARVEGLRGAPAGNAMTVAAGPGIFDQLVARVAALEPSAP